MDGSSVILAAHRGDRLKHPENTMPAFEAAIAFGVDMIETDLRMTKDGELVIMHDRSALRTTGVDRNIDEMTLEEVKSLDAGSVFSPTYQSTRIPTVKEFIRLAKDAGILVNWELKVYPKELGDEAAFTLADRLIDLIEEYGMAETSMVNSFSNRVLEHIYRKHGHRFPIHGQGISRCRRANDTATVMESELFDWCCLYPNRPQAHAIDFPKNFSYCQEHNILPCLCIPDKEDTYKTALDLGCKMFTSNNIYEADRILRMLGVR